MNTQGKSDNLDLGNLITLDEERVKEIFDHDYQNKFINLILQDNEVDFFTSISDIIVPQYFDDYQRILIDKVIKFFHKHSQIPDYNDLKRQVKIDEKNELKKEHLLGLVDNISDVKLKSNESIKDTAYQFFKKRAIADAIYKMCSLWGKDDFEAMVTPLVEALKMGEKKQEDLNYIKDIEKTLGEDIRKTIKIMDGVDEEIDGGIAGGELVVVMAPTGGGKSMVLVAMAANAIKDKKKVLYISLELASKYIAKRFHSCFTGISLKELKYYPDAIKERVESIFGIDDILAKNQSGSTLMIRQFPTRRLTVSSLKNYIDSLQRNEDFKADILFLDYADIMNSSAYDKEHRLALQLLYQDLRGMAGELGIPVITASQTNRASAKLQYLTVDNVAESWAKVAEADLILGIGRGENGEKNEDGSMVTLKDQNRATIGFLKNRMGADGFYKDSNFNTATVQISVVKKDKIQGLKNDDEKSFKNFSEKINQKTANDSINAILERQMEEK